MARIAWPRWSAASRRMKRCPSGWTTHREVILLFPGARKRWSSGAGGFAPFRFEIMPGFFMRSKLRARSKFFWAGLLRMTGVLALGKSWTRRRGVVVLTFHRVLRDPDLELTASLPGLVVREETFDRFLNYAAENCEFLDLSQDAELAPSSRLRLAVTFDDGWSDNAVIASPLARNHGVPMLIFIVPEKTGVALPFWPERAASALEQRLPAGGRRQDRGRVEQAIEDL